MDQVVELAVDVTNDDDWLLHLQKIRLLLCAFSSEVNLLKIAVTSFKILTRHSFVIRPSIMRCLRIKSKLGT